MRVKTIVDEDFSDYKKIAMEIATCFCDFKCCRELGIPISVCQNEPIYNQPNIEVSAGDLFSRYISNPLSQSIVFAGFEPMLQFDEMIEVIDYFRSNGICDDIVIFTGYQEEELQKKLIALQKYDNVVVKFGRFVPNQQAHLDPILGVKLISDNQYAKRIS